MIWQHKLAGLIEALNRQEFPALFLKTMRSVADFDSSVIMAYGVGPRPEILHDELSREFRDAFYERYLSQAAFVLSPLYQTFGPANRDSSTSTRWRRTDSSKADTTRPTIVTAGYSTRFSI